MGDEVADGRDKDIGIHDFHGINTAGVRIDEIVAGKRQQPIARLPARSPVRVSGNNPAFIKQSVLGASKKTTHASHAVGNIDRERVGGL